MQRRCQLELVIVHVLSVLLLAWHGYDVGASGEGREQRACARVGHDDVGRPGERIDLGSGREIERLGAGRRLSRRRWPQLLARAVADSQTDSLVAERAETLRRTLLSENGPANAIREIERFARKFRTP